MSNMKVVVSFLMLLAFATTQAQTMEEHWDKVCKKMQQCTLQQMEQLPDNLPDAVKAQMKAGLNAACDNAKQEFQGDMSKATAEQKKAFVACAKSWQRLSCDEIMQSNKNTPECQALEDLTN